ncbi:hypothetical protein [Streptomyces cellostaticus]|uniref:hypothetical protein n=1 Tax=Streptomyces cellostaticus TaxID=67285 RepID=UPI001428972F|nr:hypothetical protein [Streptomyces cellostaticus]GHI02719.1 hypothetical protein Scel_10400 [Streptomyces cellostaticus]
MALHQLGQAPLQVLNLTGQLPDPLSQQTQGDARGLLHGLPLTVATLTFIELRTYADQGRSPQSGQLLAQVGICGDQNGLERCAGTETLRSEIS